MWQALVRNWLMGTARQTLRQAATQAASGAMHQAGATSSEQAPLADAPPPVCHVGLVFALGIDAGGLVDRLSGVIRTEGSGFVAREGGLDGRRLVLVESGVGRAAAERATHALILGHQPRWVISTGFAGGLDESMARGDILMADQIIDTSDRRLDIDLMLDHESLAATHHVHIGRLLTSDRVIADPAEKQALGRRYGALAVDMETMGVADICRRERIRFLSVRVISDPLNHTLPDDIDYLAKQRTTAGRLGAAAGAIFRRPGSLKDMWQLKEDAILASERLAKFLAGVIAQLS